MVILIEFVCLDSTVGLPMPVCFVSCPKNSFQDRCIAVMNKGVSTTIELNPILEGQGG